MAVATVDITLVFDAVTATVSPGDPKTYNISSKALTSSDSQITLTKVDGNTVQGSNISGTISSAAVTVATFSPYAVGIASITFSNFSATINGISGAGTTVSGMSSKIQLFGTKDGAPIESGVMDVGSSAQLSVDTSNANEHKLKNTGEITVGPSGEQTGKAGDFTGATNSSGHKLTKIVFSGLTLSSNFTIDGYPLSRDAKLTLVFNEITYNSGFSLSGVALNSAPFTGSSIEIPDNPFDMAHGPTFGTVSFNFSLLHLTIACFGK